jgi:hypothetical protein
MGFQNSLGRSWRTVLRLVWGFFAAGAGAVSVDSAAANAPDVGCSDATGEGGSARAVSVEAGFVAVVIIGGGAAREGGSARAISVGAGFVTTVIIGGGAAREAGAARTASVEAGPVVLTMVEAAGFDATREAGSGRTAGATAELGVGAIRAGAGS